MKLENYKIEKAVFAIFLGMGLLFFVIGIIISSVLGNVNKDDYVEVKATIRDIERFGDKHHVYLDYQYDGDSYEDVRYNVYSSTMYVGKEINVKVNKYNPSEIYMGNLKYIFLFAFCGFGILFGAIGGIPLAIIRKKIIHLKKLKETGRPIWGTIEEVGINRSVTYNGAHPKYFVVKYEDDSIVTATSHYKSAGFYLNGDTSGFIGKNIKIYVNPQNPADYAVDLESLVVEDKYYGF